MADDLYHAKVQERQSISDLLTRLQLTSSITDLSEGRGKHYCVCYHKDLKGHTQQHSDTPKHMLLRDCHHKSFSCKYCLCSSRTEDVLCSSSKSN